MANAKTGNIVNDKASATKTSVIPSSLGLMISRKDVQERFEKMLGKKASSFLSSLLTLTNNEKSLQSANPQSVLSAAAIAASLDLPINPSLGFAWIVPYAGVAQFQIGYKGLIQLAQRSGLMKSIVMTPVYEGEIVNFNRFTERFETGEKLSDVVVGYYTAFELVNGFKKVSFWTVDDVKKFAAKYSKSYKKSSDIWKNEFDKMACKTVIMQLLKTYAPLNTEMQMAIEADGKAIVENENGMTEYIDIEATDDNEVVTEPGEIEQGEFTEDDLKVVTDEADNN